MTIDRRTALQEVAKRSSQHLMTWEELHEARQQGSHAIALTGRKLLRGVAAVLLVAVIILSAAWGVLALYYSDLSSPALRTGLAVLFGVFSAVVLVGLGAPRWRQRAAGIYLAVFVALLAWWSRIEASNERDWKPEVAVLPYATFAGDRVTVHNIRNFDYRTEADFSTAYYDRTFDLNELASVDLIASYWAGPAIAHVFLSFGFGANDHLAISIERRDERGETYSTIKGLFKQYELFYVVADERDVIRLRTNVRQDPPEDVYLYRLHGPRENGQRLFREYLREINALAERPEFYNTLTSNCTGNIWLHAHVNPGHVPYSWKILLSGYGPEYLYGQGKLDTSLPFPELQGRSRINTAAMEADSAADFSRRIRAGLPEGAPVSSRE